MKKIAKYFFAALAVASAVSCAKELTDDFRPADKVQQGKSYTFTATMADTKSVIDEETLEILWMGDKDGKEYITVLQPATDLDVAPDKIDAKAILYSASDIYEPTSFAQFSQDNEKADGIKGNVVYAVYPSANWKVFEGKDKEDETKIVVDSVRVIADYAAIQKPVAGTYDPKAPVAVAYNADIETSQDLHFMNTSALLKLQFTKTTGTVNSVKIIALGGEKISGEMLVLGIEDGAPVLVPTDAAKSHVEMVATEADGFEKGATYYIAVAPAVLSQGVALQFNEDEVQTYTVSGEIVIERGKVYDLGTFSCEEPEDAWYLVGDYNVGNANSIRKASFVEVEGKDFLVAKNVTIADGQGFKVYNPKQGVVLYPEVTDLEKNEWFPLTKDAGYGYAAMSYETYDVYVEYVNKEMTGIILVEAGAAVPEFAVPEGVFMHTTKEAGSFALCIDLENEVLKQGQFYDDYAKYMMPKDPSMEGKWYEATKTSDFTITPETAMSGKITFSDQYGPVVVNYSNYCRDSISLVSDVLPGYEVLCNCVIVDEEPEFAYPVPSGLFFYMSADYEHNYILDLGSEDGYTFRQGELFIGYEVPSGAEEFYNFFGVNGDPYCQVDNLGEVYQINPESNTTGVIYVKIGKNYYQLNYSNYEFNNAIKIDSPENMEEQPVLDENGEQMEGGWPTAPLFCTGLGLEIESASPYPMEAPRYFTYEIPAEMPTDYETPEGYSYTWFEDDYNADMVVNFGSVIENAIVKAFNYNQYMGLPEDYVPTFPFDEDMYWNPEFAGWWISEGEVFSDYQIIPTSADSGVITFVKEETGGGIGPLSADEEVMYRYYRIEYSDLTSESVTLFSPSSFNDYPVYDIETGEPLMNEMFGAPYYWEGIGFMQFDEDWNQLPMEVKIADEVPSIYVRDYNRTSPDEAQWVIYDPEVYQYFQGVEGDKVRTLLNIGAYDYYNAGGKYLNFAYSYEDAYKDPSAAGFWGTLMTPFGYTTEYKIAAGVEAEWDPSMLDMSSGVIKIEMYNEYTDEKSVIEIPYTEFYGDSCVFDLTALGLGEYKAYITPTKELTPMM